jgi:hypothetical protein
MCNKEFERGILEFFAFSDDGQMMDTDTDNSVTWPPTR